MCVDFETNNVGVNAVGFMDLVFAQQVFVSCTCIISYYMIYGLRGAGFASSPLWQHPQTLPLFSTIGCLRYESARQAGRFCTIPRTETWFFWGPSRRVQFSVILRVFVGESPDGPSGDCSSVSVCVFCPGQIQVLAGGGPTHPSLGFLRGRRV